MKQTVVQVRAFEGEYKTALLFSMIEGLKTGEKFRFVCEQNPKELELLLQDAAIPNVNWSTDKVSGDLWELNVEKSDAYKEEHIGCCGMCGGGSSAKSK
ncbi:MAG: hypothetical protein M9962_10935 [Oligoflexia bacterium]|nr:hypothetical protein [Oligoflexia bacterium]